jgi:hypothetical protein
MKNLSSGSLASLSSASLPTRIMHEILCAAIAGIFCFFEVLVFVTEFRLSKVFRRSRPASAPVKLKDLGTVARRKPQFGE